MTKNWKKCSDPKRSRIHSKWFNLDYYVSGYSIYCLSNDCTDCTKCSLCESEDCIGQFLQDTRVYYSTDNGRTKKIADIGEMPCSVEFLTLLLQETIDRSRERLLRQETS